MKHAGRKTLSVLLALWMLLSLLPAAALAGDAAADPVIGAEVEMVSHYGGGPETVTDVCFYSDAWFREDSSSVNYSLATLSAMACGASYSNEPDDHGKKIDALLKALSFSDVEMNRYFAEGIKLEQSIGCIIGRRTLTDAAGKETTLLAVFPRNAGYANEWIGNFTTGAEGIHDGFLQARDEVLRFMKQYIEKHGITGSVKVWSAGYSRGAATANLLGGFLAEDSGYFGTAVTIAPEDVFVYTIGTPLVLPEEGVTKAEALSVSEARGEAYLGYDTEGDRYAYEGDGTIDPAAARYNGIHNFIAAGDYITLLPPASWGFTRYGRTETITYGDADMLAWLALYDRATAAMFTVRGSYSTPQKRKTFDAAALRLADAEGTVRPDELIEQRIRAAAAKMGTRDDYVKTYQDLVAAAFAIYALDGSGFVENLTAKENRALIAKAGALNYLAHAKSLQPGASDADAVTESVLQAMEFAGIKKTAGDHETYTVQKAIADVLDFALNEPDEQRIKTYMEQIPENYRPLAEALYASLKAYMEETGLKPTTIDGLIELLVGWVYKERETIKPMIDPLVPERYQALYHGVYRETVSYLDYQVSNDVALPYSFDSAFAMAADFLQNVNRYETVKGLLKEALTKVPAETRELIAGGANSFPISKADRARAAEFLGTDTPDNFTVTVFFALRACVEGIEDMMQADGVRSFLINLVSTMTVPSIYKLLYGEPDVKPAELIGNVLSLALKYKDADGVKRDHGLDAAAADALTALLTKCRTDRIADQIDRLIASPETLGKLRAIAAAALFGEEEAYSVENEVSAAATFADQIGFLFPAHDHELYISWLKTRCSLYAHSYVPAGGTPEVITVPVSGEEGTVPVSATLRDGRAILQKPTEAQLAASVGDGDVAILDFTGIDGATAVEIPAEAGRALAEALPEDGMAQLWMKEETGGTAAWYGMDVPAALLPEGSSVQVHWLRTEEQLRGGLTQAQLDALAQGDGQRVFDLLLTSGGREVHDLGGREANLYIGLQNGHTVGALSAEYLAGDGSTEPVDVEQTDVEIGGGALPVAQLHLTHCSIYVLYEGSACPQDSTCPISAFTDADPAAWYHDGVHFALANGIMQGLGDGRFDPNGVTSRAMMAQILWNMEGRPGVNYAIDYTDVSGDDWFVEAVRWATCVGILDGYGDGRFGPNDDLTREQLVTIFYRYAKYKGVAVEPDANILDYADVFDISPWAVEAFRWSVQEKLVEGMGDNTLAPQAGASRAMIATVVMRYLSRFAA